MEENKTTKIVKEDGLDTEKIWAIVAYICFIFPLIFAKHKTKFLNYHINQGIILAIISVLGQIAFSILNHILWIYPDQIWNLLMFVLIIIGIINVVGRKMKPLPVIGELFTFLK